MGIHRGHDATYNALSRHFYWQNLSKHVRNCVRRCQHCIRFESLQPAHGPMQTPVVESSLNKYIANWPSPTPWPKTRLLQVVPNSQEGVVFIYLRFVYQINSHSVCAYSVLLSCQLRIW